jgi:hypothetical protein
MGNFITLWQLGLRWCRNTVVFRHAIFSDFRHDLFTYSKCNYELNEPKNVRLLNKRERLEWSIQYALTLELPFIQILSKYH